jgi:structural maintenance of chromosome 2
MVDSELTGKKILKNGNLQSRVTIVPLNKVSGRPMDQRTVDFAQKLVGPENVQSALSLIDFPEETRPAMQWIFGNVFICKDMNVAKQVAYHNNIMKKCITLQGDVFDPSGVLSGGAVAKAGSILLKLDELKEVQLALNEKEQTLNDINTRIGSINKTADRFNSLKQQFNIKQHELNMVMQRLQKTAHHQLKEEV